MLRCLFLLPLAGAVAAEISDSRMLALLTQDRNGVFILTVVALPDRTQAVVRNFAEQGREPPVVDYPRERFEQLWQQAATLDLARFAVGGNAENTAPAYNYVISVIDERDGQRQNRGYKIPKCGIAPEHEAFVRSLANGLPPSGSPGLFEPCAPAASAAQQD